MSVHDELKAQWRENQKAWDEVTQAFRRLQASPDFAMYVERLDQLTSLKGEEMLNLSDDLNDIARNYVLKGTIRGLQLASGLVSVMLQIAGAQSAEESDDAA